MTLNLRISLLLHRIFRSPASGVSISLSSVHPVTPPVAVFRKHQILGHQPAAHCPEEQRGRLMRQEKKRLVARRRSRQQHPRRQPVPSSSEKLVARAEIAADNLRMNGGDYKYIWQSSEWPNWQFDLAALVDPMVAVSRAQGRLMGRCQHNPSHPESIVVLRRQGS